MTLEQFLSMFEAMPVWQKLGWVVLCMSANLIVESVRPLFSGGYRSWKHTQTNLVFLATTMAINVAFGAAAVGLFEWTAQTGFGLIHWVTMPLWLQLLVTVATLDLIAQYTVHYLLHNWKWMWRLHMVHHSDTHVDVTTGTRHHPIDFVCRETFALIGVVVTGAPVAFYGFYRIVTIFFTYWNHSNVALPPGLDKALSWLVVTPNMHKFHHHHVAPWTDRNYGNVLSVWDRMFGTFVHGDTAEVVYGLDVTDPAESDNIRYQMVLPFNRSVPTSSTLKNH